MKPQYTDQELFVQLVTSKILSKLSFYDVTILKVFMADKPNYEPLFKTLREQQKDNEALMNGILGEEAGEILKKLIA